MYPIDRNSVFNTSGQDPSSPANANQQVTQHRFLRVRYLALAGAIITALLIGGLGGWIIGQHNSGAMGTSTGNPVQQTQTEQVAEKFHTAVVQINVQKSPTEAAIGSGVLIDPRGY